jgi:hypothetical protein
LDARPSAAAPRERVSREGQNLLDAKFGFITDIWSPAPRFPPANPGTIALVKGIQKMGIQMDRMAGGHTGVGNFADLAKTVQ